VIFRVWAPRATEVALHVEGGDIAARREDGGWWAAEADAGHGIRYGWRIDGSDPLPDPRSGWQPDGVHGLSAVDDEDFAWGDHGWHGFHLPGAVLYELHVGTFTPAGTFDGVIDRLPHLVDLGVDAIELLPVAAFPGERGWGYDGVDLFAPHDAYGGPAGLRRLVDAAHRAGIGVILDVVYNHLGPDGNHLGAFGPYFSDRHQTNWGDAVNLDGPGSDEVRRFFVDNAVGWMRDFHIDGLRLDAVHALVDDSALHLLEQLQEAVAEMSGHLRRPCWLIAESDRNDPRHVLPPEAGGQGLDASWADEWHHALHAALTGETSGYYEDFGTMEHLATGLARAWVYAGEYSAHRERRHGRSPVGLPGHRFVVSVQNHDQVGNRAIGDRIGATASEGRLRIAAALLLTSPFVPMLFQGEEWNASTPFLYFTDHQDPDLAEAVSNGRRREFASFGWDPEEVPDPQAEATFTSSVLRWDEVDDADHAELLRWYRDCIGLRRARPELTDGRWDAQRIAHDPEQGWITVQRGAVLVAAHLGAAPVTLPVPDGTRVASVDGRDLLAGATLDDRSVRLDPDGVAIALLGAG
jgi:maltooligosyltrehalose trehalohydrolase